MKKIILFTKLFCLFCYTVFPLIDVIYLFLGKHELAPVQRCSHMMVVLSY